MQLHQFDVSAVGYVLFARDECGLCERFGVSEFDYSEIGRLSCIF